MSQIPGGLSLFKNPHEELGVRHFVPLEIVFSVLERRLAGWLLDNCLTALAPASIL